MSKNVAHSLFVCRYPFPMLTSGLFTENSPPIHKIEFCIIKNYFYKLKLTLLFLATFVYIFTKMQFIVLKCVKRLIWSWCSNF